MPGNGKTFRFDYVLDPDGPLGIARESWVDTKKLGLILVDYQNYWLDTSYGSASDIVWKENGTKDYVLDRYHEIVLPNTKKLISKFRELGLQIIYLRNASFNRELLDIRGVLKKIYAYDLKDEKGTPYHMFHDEHASQIVDDIKPASNDIVVAKTSMGAFNSSDLDGILRSNGIRNLVFAGGYTDACIASTVRGAYDRGFLSILIEDACVSNSQEDHDATVGVLEKFFAWVTTTDELLHALPDES